MDEVKRECTSDERSPVIDPELRDLLPPITDEEREALTADILKNGCYSPIICMEDMTLVDGHHRYDICTEHDIPYRMVILDLRISWTLWSGWSIRKKGEETSRHISSGRLL